MPHLIWDTEHPPEQPPSGADPLIWRLAYGLRGDHVDTDADGCCTVCREPAPCHLLGVALEGLVMAVARGERYAWLTGVRDERASAGEQATHPDAVSGTP